MSYEGKNGGYIESDSLEWVWKSDKVTYKQKFESKERPSLGATWEKDFPSRDYTNSSVEAGHRAGFLLWDHAHHIGDKRKKCEKLCTHICLY